MTSTIHPLQRNDALGRLTGLADEKRLPPSLLFVGPEGSGKEWAAIELAAHLLARAGTPPPAAASGGLFGDLEPAPPPESDGSGERKARQLAHPDLYYVCPVASDINEAGYRELLDAKSREPLGRVHQPTSAIIPIGSADDPGLVSVRAIRRFLQSAPFEGEHRVVIVGDAHRMNRQSANALLKTLEEPGPFAVIVLCTHQPHLLPTTIRSRCARINVPALGEAELAAHLVAQHEVGAPEAARIAAVAGGNARRALDLLDPVARELATWGEELLGYLLTDRRVDLARAADRVAKGQPPSGRGSVKVGSDASLSAGRDVGLRVLDAVSADLVALARRAEGARLDPARAASLPESGASGEALFGGVEELLRAREDLSRNVNVALGLQNGLLRAATRIHGGVARA